MSDLVVRKEAVRLLKADEVEGENALKPCCVNRDNGTRGNRNFSF
jgi:hypothetical protein